MKDELPLGWASATLSELGSWRGGGTPSKREPAYWTNGTVPWVSPKDMKRLLIDSSQDQITPKAVAESATNLVPANSVLMVTRSGILEHSFPVAINTLPVTINQDLKAWTPRHGVDPLYVAYFLKAHAQKILAACSKDGTTVSSIDSDRLSAYQIPVAPSNEQQRIVSRIDELFSEIDEGERALERVQKLVERYRQSVLKAAVTGELTRDWRERHKGQLESGEALLARILQARRAAWEKAALEKMKAKGIKPADDKWKKKYEEPPTLDARDLPDLPNGWVWASMAQLSWASSYGTSQKCAYGGPGMAVLRIPNIRSGRFDFADVKNATADLGLQPSDGLAAGDLLTIRTNGSESLIGIGAVLSDSPPLACYFASYLIRFRLVLVDQLSEWVNFCWQSDLVRRFVHTHKATSAGQYNISQSSLLRLCLPIPPIEERQAIVGNLWQATVGAQNVLQTVSDQLKHSQALRQAVLSAAFGGKIVAQDARDEPATSSWIASLRNFARR